MIRIHLGDEPAELAAARTKHLPRLQKMHAEGKPIESEHIKDYGPPAVRAALWRAQNGKCCYCETEIEDAHEPLDHHRPKTRYWWLAHAWGNLLAACGPCNGTKKDQFPLAAGSVVLAVGEAPPGRELPLLIHPAEVHGIQHIRFELVEANGADQWIPLPRNDGDEIARQTIRVLKLDSRLLGRYQRHVKHNVMRYVPPLRLALKRQNAREVEQAHDTATRALLRRDQVLVALSYDALRHHIPDAALAPYGLAWCPPP